MSINPDWNAIANTISNDLSHDEKHEAWQTKCQTWLGALVNELEGDYRISDTENFTIVSDEGGRYIKVFSSFLEISRKRILSTLKGVASDEGFGKHVAIIFKDLDHYYDYVSMFLPEEGELGISSGMYINNGYGHFVFPTQDMEYAEPIAVHELTHACLSHLPIPTWLNEGLAVLMEEVLANNTLYIDKEIVAQHHQYWNEKNIQEFWSGDSFYASDEGQGLSYHLAHILLRNISQDYTALAAFTNSANMEDAGESVAMKTLGVSLGDLAASFLGEGNWEPVLINDKRVATNTIG